jgi:hypothetical protein
MRQVAGDFMEYEKGRLVAKLRGARERKRKETGKKVGGLKSHVELWPEVVAEGRRTSEGERQSRASELPRNQRQTEGCRLLQRAWTAFQPAVGSSND